MGLFNWTMLRGCMDTAFDSMPHDELDLPVAFDFFSHDCFAAAPLIDHSNTFLDFAFASFITNRQQHRVGFTNGQGPMWRPTVDL